MKAKDLLLESMQQIVISLKEAEACRKMGSPDFFAKIIGNSSQKYKIQADYSQI